MANTFTLNIGNKIFGDAPLPRLSAKVYPIADSTTLRKLKYIKDTVANQLITGHAETKATPEQLYDRMLPVPDLPDPRDTTYGPNGFGLLVEVDAYYFKQTFMFGAAEIAAHINAGVVELEDVIEDEPAAFTATVLSDLTSRVAALVARVDDLEAQAPIGFDTDGTPYLLIGA